MTAIKLKPTRKWKTVNTSTIKGLRRAEWLKSHGWKIISTGFNTITFEKKVSK